MVVEQAAGLFAPVAIGRRLHRQNSNSVDVVIGVKAGVASLIVPVVGHAVAVAGEGIEPAPRIVFLLTRPLGGDFPVCHFAVGKAFALVKAGRADEGERRPLREVSRFLSVVGEPRDRARLVNAVNPPIRHNRPRPAFVVVRIVLDQEHIARLANRLAVLDQVDAAVELRQVRVLVIRRTRRVDTQQMVVRRARRVRQLT
jgi:hypothetical protein